MYDIRDLRFISEGFEESISSGEEPPHEVAIRMLDENSVAFGKTLRILFSYAKVSEEAKPELAEAFERNSIEAPDCLKEQVE